jgi:tRNA dimethylallyltransferase
LSLERLSTNIQNKTKVILLFGPTAVGKTDLLLRLFQGRAEVISVDSVQVYRDLDIGSAKPDAIYLDKLPHHLIDILDTSEVFSAGDFVRLADNAVHEIKEKALIPLLSGGTAFYFKNFLFGLPLVKGDTSEARSLLLQSLQSEGLPSLWQELLRVDPAYGKIISCNDSQRILRALEVYRSTGRPLSSFKVPNIPSSTYDFLIIGLKRDRAELYERINLRVRWMFQQGLEEEVFGLVNRGYSLESPGMKAIGYREFFDADGQFRSGEEVLREIQMNTRRYAKRQMTFFKSLPAVHWFHPDDKDNLEQLIERFLMDPSPPLTQNSQ